MSLSNAILEMHRRYEQATGRRLGVLAVSSRLYFALTVEMQRSTSFLSERNSVPTYSPSIRLGPLTVYESIGEGMVWA